LVHVHTYGPSRFNKKYQWEAIRSCSKLNHQVMGGFSRCDKNFFAHNSPESIISYVDLSLSIRQTELMFPGWETVSTNSPSAPWVNMRSSKPLFIRDLSAQKLSAERLLGFEVSDRYPRFDSEGKKITTDFVLLAEGYVKVFAAGTRSFRWLPS
jgi:hypothetical protein